MNLEIDRYERFRSREHRVTQAGAIIMTGIVAAAALGLLGPGIVSSSTARSPGGVVEVEHHRIAHQEADEDIAVTVAPAAVQDGVVVVELTGPWVGATSRDGVAPQPVEETLVPGGTRMEFAADAGDELELTITYRAAELWSLPLTVTVGGESAELTQFVLP